MSSIDDGPPLLVLDLDGTLVDSAPGLAACANRMLLARGLGEIDVAELRPMVGDGVPVLVQRVLASRRSETDAAAVDAFTADYTAHAAEGSSLFPGVVDMLAAARAAGWQLAVCTNKPVAATGRLLDALGIASLLAATGGGDSFPVRKPDPAHLLGTVALAGGDPARTVMVGDHRNDVTAARGAGIPVIFAGWGYGTVEMQSNADLVVLDPAKVPAAAATLLSERGEALSAGSPASG